MFFNLWVYNKPLQRNIINQENEETLFMDTKQYSVLSGKNRYSPLSRATDEI